MVTTKYSDIFKERQPLMNTLTNKCINPKTLQIFNRIGRNPHVHTRMMSRDDSAQHFKENAEIVLVAFEHANMDFTVAIDVLSECVKVYSLAFDEYLEEYGDTTFEKLIQFLDGLPHINSILNVAV